MGAADISEYDSMGWKAAEPPNHEMAKRLYEDELTG
jgi:hypothetical protein